VNDTLFSLQKVLIG